MIRKSIALEMQKDIRGRDGGKNPAIVTKHADIDAAVDGIASAAFGFDGQKMQRLLQSVRAGADKGGVPQQAHRQGEIVQDRRTAKKEVYMGPLISEKALAKYVEAIGEANRSGRVLCGGNIVNAGLDGIYVEPAIVEVEQGNRLMHDELFVPVLAVDTFKKFDEAILKANDTEYGLTARAVQQECCGDAGIPEQDTGRGSLCEQKNQRDYRSDSRPAHFCRMERQRTDRERHRKQVISPAIHERAVCCNY